MRLKSFFVISFILLLVCATYAQNTRDVAPTPPKPVYQANKKKAAKQGFFYRLFHKKTKIQTGEEEIIEFRKRVRKRVKANAKLEKKSMTPQYQDPLYFGHKKPPKKRKNGKKKFCKECGLKH